MAPAAAQALDRAAAPAAALFDLDAEGADVCDAKPEVDTIDLDAEGADACDAKPEVVTVDVDACDGADGGE